MGDCLLLIDDDGSFEYHSPLGCTLLEIDAYWSRPFTHQCMTVSRHAHRAGQPPVTTSIYIRQAFSRARARARYGG